MKQGFWINYESGERFLIHEHEDWIRVPANAEALGIPRDEVAFSVFPPKVKRNLLLLSLIQRYPIMRVRGHGDDTTFEYACPDPRGPIEAIRSFGSEFFGPYSELNIVNFEPGLRDWMFWEDFETRMSRFGPESILAFADEFSLAEGIREELRAGPGQEDSDHGGINGNGNNNGRTT